MLSEVARNGGAEAVINLALRYPNAFHLSTEDEMQMIGEIGKISTAKEASKRLQTPNFRWFTN
jgi:hypothetical protein